jgi:hypothetical protein
MYITVGPPCCGKTTFLSQQISTTGTAIHDVTLDNQLGVYVPVDTELFLPISSNGKKKIKKKRIQGRFLEDRIKYDNEELTYLIKLFHGDISLKEYTHAIQEIYLDWDDVGDTSKSINYGYTAVGDELISAVLQYYNTGPCQLPNKTQLYVVESIFRPNPKTNKTGVESAQEELLQYATAETSTIVSWGNTNTMPREFTTALHAAQQGGRAVYFIVYGDPSIMTTTAAKKADEEHQVLQQPLPKVPLGVLLQRNIQRYLMTGKYIPAKVIFDFSNRADSIISTAWQKVKKHNNNDSSSSSHDGDDLSDNDNEPNQKWKFDATLAKLANFEMHTNRTVTFIQPTAQKKQEKNLSPKNIGIGRGRKEEDTS